MSFLVENQNLIINIVTATIAAVVAYLASKRQNNREDKTTSSSLMRSDFDALVKANSEFRDEIRKDLLKAKTELEEAKIRIGILEDELEKRAAKILELEKTIERLMR